jgi:hypothetical protein
MHNYYRAAGRIKALRRHAFEHLPIDTGSGHGQRMHTCFQQVCWGIVFRSPSDTLLPHEGSSDLGCGYHNVCWPGGRGMSSELSLLRAQVDPFGQ